ncbi:MAG: metallophosphoesterase [Minisyncoccia bacterium]|jgi:predicted MPP superfamily phosphohydrolase
MALAAVLVLVTLQVLLIFVHCAVYATLAAAFGIGGTALKIVFTVLAFTFLSASVLAHRYRGRVIDWFYTAAAYWFGLVHFLFVGAILFVLSANVLYRTNYYVPPPFLGGVAFGALFLLHCYGTWKSGRVATMFVDVALPHLPASWRGKAIVFVSDLHLGNVRRQAFARRVAEKIRALHPEAVAIGGDLYDGTRCDAAALIEPLRSLRPPKGVYFVTGNHEYFLPNMAEALAAIRALGIGILNNEVANLEGLAIAGVDNRAVHHKNDFARVLHDMSIPKDKPTILIKHEPSHLTVARDAGISLILSGHAHHGQIFPLNVLTRRIYHGFDYGLKRLDRMWVYTSSGAGTWGPPLRLGTKSEIVCITLR